MQSQQDIAIIGMAGKFPGAKNISEFWKNILGKKESITFFTEKELLESGVSKKEISDSFYIKSKGFLSNASLFDAVFFGVNPSEAALLDPQFRLFLETAWEALENAACVPGQKPSERIGVFAGSSSRNTYYINNLLQNQKTRASAQDLPTFVTNAKDFLATWVAYKLNLTGPSMTIQTACSTSLVAISQACDSLRNGHCDVALAGGVSITTPLKSGYSYQEGMILSRDGHCRAFDNNATGTVAGNGVGIIVLKRLDLALKEKDYIHAIIKGAAINNDGHQKIGFYAPSILGQQQAIERALKNAGIKPSMISYIETHGTGTYKGDPVEITALKNAFSSVKNKRKIPLGSVKPNIGHLDVASGIAGCIKTIEALKHKIIPPHINFKEANIEIDFPNSPFYVNTNASEWQSNGRARYAGVSSFGIGGTNAHLILQEAPTPKVKVTYKKNATPVLLVLSAKVLSVLVKYRRSLCEFLQQNPETDLESLAKTLQVGRKPFGTRYACICSSTEEAIKKLSFVTDRTGAATGFTLTKAQLKNKKYRQLISLAKRWLAGKSVPWEKLKYGKLAQKIPLPTYPLERKEFWISPDLDTSPKPMEEENNTPNIEESLLKIFKSFLGMDIMRSSDDFYDFGGDSLLSLQVIAEIQKQLGITLSTQALEKHSSPQRLARYIEEKSP